MAGCVARTPFREQVEAASRAGFVGITTWPNIWRHAQVKGGFSLRDMARMLDDNGLRLEQVEAVPEWPPSEETIATCAALGGGIVVGMRLAASPLELAREAEIVAGFAELAAGYGVRTAIEFVAFSGIPDVATAWTLIQLSGSDTGLVVDLCHHRRSGKGDSALLAISPDRIVSIQLADGPAKAPDDLLHEASMARQWPGEGDFGAADFVRALRVRDVDANLGLELHRPEFAALGADRVITRLAAATRPFL